MAGFGVTTLGRIWVTTEAAKVNFARPSTSINPLTDFSKQMIFWQIPSLANGPSPALIPCVALIASLGNAVGPNSNFEV
jgi:hypothetical protein